MSLIVQKYGGSSVASLDHIRRVARRIEKSRAAGYRVVVVVSAMGKTTSELLGQAQAITPEPAPRELDMLLSAGERISMSLLAMALDEVGIEAISLTGPQAGIRTDTAHFNARITGVEPARVRAELEAGRVVVVAGYQGATPLGEVATLGRGGSDTTAVALAAALDAERCEICSDVDGIYTADPRVVATAKRIEKIAYEDMLVLARHGARVLNARAVNYARRTTTPMHSLSTFGEGAGTLVYRGERRTGNAVGVAAHGGLLRIEWKADPDRETPAQALDILEVNEAFHSRSSPASGAMHHELTVPVEQLAEREGSAAHLRAVFAAPVKIQERVGSVSVVGTDLNRQQQARRRFMAHTARFTTDPKNWLESPDALCCLLPESAVDDATRALHEEFIERPRLAAA